MAVVSLRRIAPWVLMGALGLVSTQSSRVPELEADAAVRATVVEQARLTNLAPVNPYATLARPAPPRIDVKSLVVRQKALDRLVGYRRYTVRLEYTADDRALCDRFSINWVETRGAWTSRTFKTRGCKTWF